MVTLTAGLACGMLGLVTVPLASDCTFLCGNICINYAAMGQKWLVTAAVRHRPVVTINRNCYALAVALAPTIRPIANERRFPVTDHSGRVLSECRQRTLAVL